MNTKPENLRISIYSDVQEELILERRRNRSNDLVPADCYPPTMPSASTPPTTRGVSPSTRVTPPTGVALPTGVTAVPPARVAEATGLMEAQDHLTALLSESHTITHRHNRTAQPPVDKGEESQGITAGLGTGCVCVCVVCMCVCMCTCVRMCECMWYICVCMHVCMCVRMCVCVHVCMCMYACVSICVFVCWGGAMGIVSISIESAINLNKIQPLEIDYGQCRHLSKL